MKHPITEENIETQLSAKNDNTLEDLKKEVRKHRKFETESITYLRKSAVSSLEYNVSDRCEFKRECGTTRFGANIYQLGSEWGGGRLGRKKKEIERKSWT